MNRPSRFYKPHVPDALPFMTVSRECRVKPAQDSPSMVIQCPDSVWDVRDEHPVRCRVKIHKLLPQPDWFRSDLRDLDPFGFSWKTHLSTFLLLYYIQDNKNLEVEEVISAMRISRPDMFGYHIYFKASNRKIVGEESQDLVQHKIFAEVNIGRHNLKEFTPDVLFCKSMSQASEYQDGCHYCPRGVRHPVGMGNIMLRPYPDYVHVIRQVPGVLTPLSAYITENVQELDYIPLHLPLDLFSEDMPSEEDIAGCVQGGALTHGEKETRNLQHLHL